eukprot:c21221_g1_i1 orf=220-1224(-)
MGQGQADEKAGKKVENKVVLRVDMDCEACKQKVRKVLKRFPGVENIELDMDEQKVTVKGHVDAWKVYEALKKKCGKRTMLLYPQFSKEDERKAKEDSIINSVTKIVDSITDLLNPKPPDTVVELKVRMHCGACAKKIKRILLRMDGVVEVEGDMTCDKVVVKGRGLDPEAVCDWVRESGKHCEFVSIKKEEKPQEKKKGAKKEEKKEEKEEVTEEKEEKKEEKQEPKKKGKKAAKKGENKEESKGEEDKTEKEEKKEEKKGEDKKEGKDEKNGDTQEAKTEENNDAKKPSNEGGGHEGALEVKKYAYTAYQSVPEYVYAPQIFSDENPNACSLM